MFEYLRWKDQNEDGGFQTDQIQQTPRARQEFDNHASIEFTKGDSKYFPYTLKWTFLTIYPTRISGIHKF